MIRMIRNISAVTLACILALSTVVSAAGGVAHCPTMAGDRPMEMDPCDGLLNFGASTQGCFGNCNDVFCDLVKDPFKEANTLTSSHYQASGSPIHGIVESIDAECSARNLPAEPKYLLSEPLLYNLIPLYMEHSTFII